MQIYKFRLLDLSGWGNWTDTRIIADTLEEATILLRKSHREKNWSIHSIDTFEIKKGPVY